MTRARRGADERGAVLVVTVVAVNLLVDLLYAVIDPRIRHARVFA